MENNILVCYTEFMPYNLAAFKAYSRISNSNVYVIYWDQKKLTPYAPSGEDRIHFIPRSGVTFKSATGLVKTLKPKLLFISGWSDLLYDFIAFYSRRRKIDVVLGFDNHWKNGIKQFALLIVARMSFRFFFSGAFVPGNTQYLFARKLGFSHTQIRTGAYTANIECFKEGRRKKDLSSILFIGRLSPVKGIDMLTRCFVKLKEKKNYSSWKLIVVGDGELRSQLPQHPSIIYRGFLSQEEIANVVEDVSFFCLPSMEEPWGLVVHEMSAAELPLLLSDVCGSAEDFLIDKYNGLLFHAGDEEALYDKLNNMMLMDGDELSLMGKRSRELSERNSPEIWSYKLMSFIREK